MAAAAGLDMALAYMALAWEGGGGGTGGGLLGGRRGSRLGGMGGGLGKSWLVMTAGGLRIVAHGLYGRAFAGIARPFALARGPGFGAGWLGSRGVRRSGLARSPAVWHAVRWRMVGFIWPVQAGVLGVGTPGMRSDMSDMSDIARKRVCKSEVRSEGGCAGVCGAATVYGCGQPATIH